MAALSGCTEEVLEEAEGEPPIFGDFHAEEEVSLPVDQRLGIGADGVRQADGVEIADLEDLETFLEEQGLRVESIEEAVGGVAAEGIDEAIEDEIEPTVDEHEPIVSLEYEVSETNEEGLMHHLGIVAGGYAGLIEADHGSEMLEASLFQPDGKQFGEYEVRRYWTEEYLAGDLSARAYSGEVLGSAESI